MADQQKKKNVKSKLVQKLRKNERDLELNEKRLAKKGADKAAQVEKQEALGKNEEEVEDIENEFAEEEEEAGEWEDEIVENLPVVSISNKNKDRLRKIKESPAKDDNKKSNVVYLGHIPFGLFEYQLNAFLKQFGEVQRSYISKNKKTGRSRGYGFIEFVHPEVAEIVADTMHDYLMFKKRLVCRILPQIKVAGLPWPTNQITEPKPFKAQQDYAQQYNVQKPVTAASLLEKERKKRKNLALKKIDYHFDGYAKLVSELKGKEAAAKGRKDVEEEKKADEEQAKQWEQRKKEKVAREKAAHKAQKQKQAKKEEKDEERLKKRKKGKKSAGATEEKEEKEENGEPAAKKPRQQA